MVIPPHKADINTGTILLMILKGLESVYKFNTEDLVKHIHKVNPEAVFKPSNGKARLSGQ